MEVSTVPGCTFNAASFWWARRRSSEFFRNVGLRGAGLTWGSASARRFQLFCLPWPADRGLTTGDFFAASVAFFWRLVRLMLLSIIPFVVVGAIYQGLDKLSDYFGNKAVADQVGIFSWWASMVVFLLLALAVRLWFDVAQVRAVAKNERGMWRNLWKAYRITWGDLGGLFWMYFRIGLFAWVTLALGVAIWAHLPPTATPVTFVLLELILLAQLVTRFWRSEEHTSELQSR